MITAYRLADIRAAHARYVAAHPPRFAVVGTYVTTHHQHIETATALNTRRQARVVVRLEDGVEMTVARRAVNVDRLLRQVERARPVDDPEELPDADAEGEDTAAE